MLPSRIRVLIEIVHFFCAKYQFALPIVQRGTKVTPVEKRRERGRIVAGYRELRSDRVTLFVPIYVIRVSDMATRSAAWVAFRFCFFHPRHLRSRYLFKVNGTGLAQVCPKIRGFGRVPIPIRYSIESAKIDVLRFSFPRTRTVSVSRR